MASSPIVKGSPFFRGYLGKRPSFVHFLPGKMIAITRNSSTNSKNSNMTSKKRKKRIPPHTNPVNDNLYKMTRVAIHRMHRVRMLMIFGLVVILIVLLIQLAILFAYQRPKHHERHSKQIERSSIENGDSITPNYILQQPIPIAMI